jgi:hypothetical protein
MGEAQPDRPASSSDRMPVGVFPGEQLERYAGFFRGLEAVLNVRFVARSPYAWDGLSAALLLGCTAGSPPIPCFEAPEPELRGKRTAAPVSFARNPALDRCLHGRVLADDHVAEIPPLGNDAGVMLARGPHGPVWALRRERGAVVHRVNVSPIPSFARSPGSSGGLPPSCGPR